jgi:hypothetical protein
MLAELTSSRSTDEPENLGNQSNIFKIVDPLRLCGRGIELVTILESL